MTKETFKRKKSWLQRKGGIMKKADELRDKFSARVAVLIERDGILYAYLSHEDFPSTIPGKLKSTNKMKPEDYITLAQHNRGDSMGPSPVSTPGSEPLKSAEPESVTTAKVKPMLTPPARSYFDMLDFGGEDSNEILDLGL